MTERDRRYAADAGVDLSKFDFLRSQEDKAWKQYQNNEIPVEEWSRLNKELYEYRVEIRRPMVV